MPDFENHGDVIGLLQDAQQVEHDNRELLKEAHVFVSVEGGQWEPERFKAAHGKPRYTFDQTSPIIDQIAGDIEESDFDIKISPKGGGATKEMADLRDGMIRNIESLSQAQTIYANAARNVVTAGFDGWRVTTEFTDEMKFEQDLVIEAVHNWVERVWFDPGSKRRDRADSKYGFLLSDLTFNEYKERFPDGSGMSVGVDRTEVVVDDVPEGVVIGHFYFQKMERVRVVLTSLGRVFEDDEKWQKIKDELAASGETVKKEKFVERPIFWVRKFDGGDWLEDGQDTVFSTIPLVAAYGNFKVIENQTMYHGVVRKLMDPQRVLNYSLSREIEEGALAPRQKKWMTQEQSEGFQEKLQTMNTNAEPVQFYNHVEGQPPPFETGGAEINPGLRNISTSMTSLMGSTAGIFAAGMGDTPEFTQSGVAIDKLQDKSNNITSKYFKAMEIPICYTAKLLDGAIPRVYDTERHVRILKEDGVSNMIEANHAVVDEETGDEVILNDLRTGKYDITCRAGRAFDSRQSETVDGFLKIGAVDPSIIEIGSDIMLKNMNTPGMDQVSDRKRNQLLQAGVIPEDQWTEDEQRQQAEAAQTRQPDAAMVMAQAEREKAAAEQAKADAANARVQVELFKLQTGTQIKAQELALKAQEISIRDRESILKIEEKRAELGLDADKQQFEQDLAVIQENRQANNDFVNNLNTDADTLKKIREGMGVEVISGPNAAQAFIGQAQDLNETINDERIEDGRR